MLCASYLMNHVISSNLNFTFGNAISPFYCLSFWYHSFVQRTSIYDTSVDIDFQVMLRSVEIFK